MSDLRHVPLPDLVAAAARRTTSPFDAIKRVDERGEWWSSRELMPMMQYGRWDSFAAVVEKARASLALVAGDPSAASNFLQVQKVSERGPAGADVRLTRFAAYLVAMAGDDTKPAVAQARIYFAVKAREAEVAPARPALPQSFADALQLAADQARQIERQGQQIAELEPSAAAWNQIASGVKDWDVADCAKFLSNDPSISIGRDRLFERLLEMGWVYRGGDGRWRAKQSEVDLERLAEMPQTRQRHSTGERVRTAPQVRITPKGLRELHKRLGGTQPLQINEQLTLD